MSAKATRSTGNTIHHSLLSDLAVTLSFVPGGGPGLCCFVVCPLELSVVTGSVTAGSLTEGVVPVLGSVSVTTGSTLCWPLVTTGAVVFLATTVVGAVEGILGASVFTAVVTGAGAALVVFTVTTGLVVSGIMWGVVGAGLAVVGSTWGCVVIIGVAGAAGANVVSDETGMNTWAVASRSSRVTRAVFMDILKF